MRVVIAGACGFAGSTLALQLREAHSQIEIVGVDNFIRPGSELNRQRLAQRAVRVVHADVRVREDLDALPKADWVIDASANPSVLAGTRENTTTSRLLMQHNLAGTVNLLELCRSQSAGFILLSTSRVYSIAPIAALRMDVEDDAFTPDPAQSWPAGAGPAGLTERFPTSPPVSLYGASKVCSETLALEYGSAFQFPVWINRLGVLAGAGQFGRADQGIFSYWIHSCAARRAVSFTGFGGHGHQVRDCLHPRDLTVPLLKQMKGEPSPGTAITNFAGGRANSLSLKQLHAWCERRFGGLPVGQQPETHPFDVPWLVLDAGAARERFGWTPATTLDAILTEIADHAAANPHWLDWTAS